MSDSLCRHYHLSENPFGRNAPTTALHQHAGFNEARQRLRFTIELEGLGALIGEPGCGKSLLLGAVSAEHQKHGGQVHYFAHATVGPFGFLNVLARKLGLAPRRSRAETAQYVSEVLLKDERKHLLILDEAHLVPDDTLEDVRLLTIADFDRKSPFVLLLATSSSASPPAAPASSPSSTTTPSPPSSTPLRESPVASTASPPRP